jgi:hypothetical protein
MMTMRGLEVLAGSHQRPEDQHIILNMGEVLQVEVGESVMAPPTTGLHDTADGSIANKSP